MTQDYDFTGMRDEERYRYTVGELHTAIDNPATAETEDLMKATEIAWGLLADAVCAADDKNDVTFFETAYGIYGPLIDTALGECGRDVTRDSVTGRLRPPIEDCTIADLQREIDKRREASEATGIEHSAECQNVDRVMQVFINAMRALGVRTVGELTPGLTMGEMEAMTPQS